MYYTGHAVSKTLVWLVVVTMSLQGLVPRQCRCAEKAARMSGPRETATSGYCCCCGAAEVEDGPAHRGAGPCCTSSTSRPGGQCCGCGCESQKQDPRQEPAPRQSEHRCQGPEQILQAFARHSYDVQADQPQLSFEPLSLSGSATRRCSTLCRFLL
jgi:hypothetical protein